MILILNFVVIKLIVKEDGFNFVSKFINNDKCENNSPVSLKILIEKIIKLSISLYRASVFIITSIAIIAVDFKIFPRIHAKTTEFGLSLMDLGISYEYVIQLAIRLIKI